MERQSLLTIIAGIALVGTLLLGALPGSLRAEEEDDESLVVRLFDVGALTYGMTDHIPPVMGIVDVHGVSDEENPLFGAEGEEPWLPVGTIDELIELIKNNVDPVSWEVTEGTDVRSQGEAMLVVRARRSVLRAVEAYLIQLERALLAPFTVDLRTVELPETPRPSMSRGRALTTEEADHLLDRRGPGVTLTARSGQRAVAFQGHQYSFVQDYDVEVAQGAMISDPIVGVGSFGLGASVRAMQGNDKSRLRLELDAVLSLHRDTATHTTEDGKRIIMLPIYDELRIATDLVLVPGAWHVADAGPMGEDGVTYALLVRATPHPFTSRPGETFAELPAVTADTGPLETRTFDVSDLGAPRENLRGAEINLVPSNFTPPEPPELPEPMPIFPEDAIVDLVRESVAPRSWSRKGTFIEARQGRVSARNTARVLDAVQRLLDGVRREFLFTVAVDVEIVEAPTRLAEALTNAGEGKGASYLLGPRGRAALEAALTSEEARRLARGRVMSLSGAQNAVTSGRRVTYVQDFEVEIAESATIANPVTRSVLSGLVADLRPALTSTGDAVQIEARITRSDLQQPLRWQTSPHGDIHVPDMAVMKLRSDLRVPLDQTAVQGMGVGEERTLLVLLTPHLKRFGD